jgi:hypothetical protein
MNSQHRTSIASNELHQIINIETSNNTEIISSDTKDLLIDTTNVSVVLDCVELTQESQKEVKLQAQLTKYDEDYHLQNEFIKVLNINIQIALRRSRALQLRETDLK